MFYDLHYLHIDIVYSSYLKQLLIHLPVNRIQNYENRFEKNFNKNTKNDWSLP